MAIEYRNATQVVGEEHQQRLRIAPAHCTGHLAFKILKDMYGEDYVFAGLGERTKI